MEALLVPQHLLNDQWQGHKKSVNIDCGELKEKFEDEGVPVSFLKGKM